MTKQELYESILAMGDSLLQGQKYECTILANSSALLYQELPDLNWAGYYVLKNGKLILSSFQGKVACMEIPLGKGVCGTAAHTGQTQLVKNVHEFPGHIACDSASNSEIVIPLTVNGKLYGVLDIDSPLIGRFDQTDREYLEKFSKIICSLLENAE